MRRAVVAVIVGGFSFGGIGSGLGHQPVIGAGLTADVRPALTNANLTAVIRAAKKTARKATQKTISYQGVEFSVPADWPVYWLNKDPDQCVRYDRNAVYVGTPGPDQNCPPGLIGRADTITIGAPSGPAGPTGPATSNLPAETYQRASVPAKPAKPAKAPVRPGTIFQNPDLHEFAVAMPSSAPRIYATYGTDPALVKQTLATVRHITPLAAPLGSSKSSAKLKATNPAWPKVVQPPTGIAAIWPGAQPPAPQPLAPQPPAPEPTLRLHRGPGWPMLRPRPRPRPCPRHLHQPPRRRRLPVSGPDSTPAPPRRWRP